MKKCDHYIIRANDILLSVLALIFLSPVLVLVIVILRLTGEGEVFYFQERIGKSSRSFKVFKFATMLKNSPNIGTGTLTIKDDPKIYIPLVVLAVFNIIFGIYAYPIVNSALNASAAIFWKAL